MITENKLRKFRDDVQQYFIHEFAGLGKEIDYYVPVSLPYKWLNNYSSHAVKKINTSDYEQTLINFIENPEGTKTTHPLWIIIGGAGTGKTSTIQYAVENANVCSGCPRFIGCNYDYPGRMKVDFLKFKEEATVIGSVANDDNKVAEERKRFWNYLSKLLQNILGEDLPINTEVTDFWMWLLEGEKDNVIEGTHNTIVNRKLEANKHLIKDAKANGPALQKLREDIYDTLSDKEYTYYKLYKIAYVKKNQKVNCSLLIFDNIDRLHPEFQIELINFTIEANNLLNVKAIIPMRPHTFEITTDASTCIEVIDHCMPEIKNVVNKRMEIYDKKDGDKEIHLIMNRIVDVINSSKTMSEVFYSASGGSVRFALRNLYNLFLSPLIITHEDGAIISPVKFDTNIFFQSFFCSEDHHEDLDEENFINIVSSKKGFKMYEPSLIKLRALHYLNKYIAVRTEDFVSHLRAFGYFAEDILEVVNDFLKNKKSLMWSNARNKYELLEIENPIKKHNFYLTPMGESYYKILICYPSYLFECVHSLEGGAKTLTSSMNQLDKFIKQLFITDAAEIKTYCKRKSVSQYRGIYSLVEPCISSILFFKLFPNFDFLSSKMTRVAFDVYGNYMVREANNILDEIQASKRKE